MKYQFIRVFEKDVTKKLSNDLEEFREFCHYSSLSDWQQHKDLIEKCLKESDCYAFTGNDVEYYVFFSPTQSKFN